MPDHAILSAIVHDRLHTTDFVGRLAELARFNRAIEDARNGLPSVVLVSGEAGIGKTTIVSESAVRAEGVPGGPQRDTAAHLAHSAASLTRLRVSDGGAWAEAVARWSELGDRWAAGGLSCARPRRRPAQPTAHVSDKTASVHVSNILRKLGVNSRVDAAAVAQRLGIA